MGSEDAEWWALSDRFSRSSPYISSITHLAIHRPADSPIYTSAPARSFISFHLSCVHPSPHPSCHHPSRPQHSFLPPEPETICLATRRPPLWPLLLVGGGGVEWGTVSGDQQSITVSKKNDQDAAAVHSANCGACAHARQDRRVLGFHL